MLSSPATPQLLVELKEVVIGGWTPGAGRRSGMIGALLLGVYEDGRLRYAGHVGTGFSEAVLRDLYRRLERLSRPDSPFAQPVPRVDAPDAHWVEPELVGEVEHRQWTTEHRLRHPSWRGLRPDKDPHEVEAP